jgi:hypothetical protein
MCLRGLEAPCGEQGNGDNDDRDEHDRDDQEAHKDEGAARPGTEAPSLASRVRLKLRIEWHCA